MKKEIYESLSKNDLVSLCMVKDRDMRDMADKLDSAHSEIEDLKHTIELTDDLIADMEVD